jgi:hypothetical protein
MITARRRDELGDVNIILMSGGHFMNPDSSFSFFVAFILGLGDSFSRL